MKNAIYLTNYYPVGDLIVISICVVMMVLMFFSYNRKTRSYGIFLGLIGLLILSALSNVSCNLLARSGQVEMFGLADAIRILYHASLFAIFLLYVAYIVEVTMYERKKAIFYYAGSAVIYLTVVAVDIVTTLNGHAAFMSEKGVEASSRHIFFIGYICFVGLIVVLMRQIRDRLYRKVMFGFYGSMAVSFLMLFLQGIHRNSSFTVATFLYPVIAMFYIMHSNPYDVNSGAMDSRSMDDLVRYEFTHDVDFVFMSLYLPDFDGEGLAPPDEVQATIRAFTVKYFRGATLFRVRPGLLMLICTKKKNPDYEDRMRAIMTAFIPEYERFKYDYKIVYGEAVPEISQSSEYGSFIRNILRGMEMNTMHQVNGDDVTTYQRDKKLLETLNDIYARQDLDDPRVLVYCQPVYNIRTGKYDTAEALMRLEIEDLGMVFPDCFIPLAEENGQIHALTTIILHKTCEAVKQLLAQGYEVCRVSVNVSAIELKDEHFCQDVVDVINRTGISGEKIAIELTESRTDSDFDHTKQMIEQLRQYGIKFYLDDFGTGYSNMERIMELPFDIIKFDRSMVLASESSERSKTIVLSLANMFDGLNYSVLYEGVEQDFEEQMCKDMSASYLQGYKYSRPVPIAKLRDYFSKAS